MSVIKEGFICAECHEEFTSVEGLLTHYKNSHPVNDDSNTIKGLFEKTKSRLVSRQPEPELLRLPPKYFDLYDDGTTIGKSNSHFDYFKKIRSAQVERCSTEANRLLIRLQKIMKFEGDESKRRAHEQEVVQWVDEKHVSRCPDCTQPFTLLLRRHHCRLCGSILCEHCSNFLPFQIANCLVLEMGNPTSTPTKKNQTNGSLTTSSKPKPKLDYAIRTCPYCQHLVMKKHKSLLNSGVPLISQHYEKLRSLISSCEARNEEYNNVVNSLNRGEKLYSIEQCTTLRNELIKITEQIDIASKRISVLGGQTEATQSETELRLRGRVRTGTINWIRGFLAGIRQLPLLEDKVNGAAVVSVVDGWTPSKGSNSGAVILETDDVMEIQIANMKMWIDEARQAKKYDEVEMLEANLTELLQFHYTNNSSSK